MGSDPARDLDIAESSMDPLSDDSERRFRTMFDARYSAVYAYAFRRLPGGREDALDVTSEVFATAWRRREIVPAEPSDLLWLYGVARRVVSRHERGGSRRVRLVQRLQFETLIRGPDAEEPQSFNGETIRSSILELKPIDREVLSLLFWEQLSHEEVAQILGCSPNAVAQRFRKAKRRLRNRLELEKFNA